MRTESLVIPAWRGQLRRNKVFETMLGDPAGGSALRQRQPDGNEVQRVAGGGGGEFLLFKGKRKQR